MNLFSLIYALLAMSLIKPAEKFFRDMFGVNGKVANTGSFESGKALMDATAKMVATTAATIATGGALAGVGNAIKGVATKKITKDVIKKTASSAAKKVGGTVKKAGKFVTSGTAEKKAAINRKVETVKKARDRFNAAKDEFDKANKIEFKSRTRRAIARPAALITNVAKKVNAGLADTKKISGIMATTGSFSGIRSAMSAGVGDSGSGQGFLRQLIEERSKKAGEIAIANVAANEEYIKSLAEELYQTEFKDMYNGNEKRERKAARDAAEAKLKSMASKWVPYGINDLALMKILKTVSKEEKTTDPEIILREFRLNSKYAELRKKYIAEKEAQKIKQDLEEELIDKIKSSSTGSYTITSEDGEDIEINLDDILDGTADKIIRTKVNFIMKRGNTTGEWHVEGWDALNNEAKSNKVIIDRFKIELNNEVVDGSHYQLVRENGTTIDVTDGNIDSPQVQEALKSKLKFMEGDPQMNLNDANRLERTRAALLSNNISEPDVHSIKTFDQMIETYRKKNATDRYEEVQNNTNLDDSTRRILAAEIKARNEEEKRKKV